MKQLLQKLTVMVVAISSASTSNAVSISSALDGMYINATTPHLTSSQFRGSLGLGGLYLRTPIEPIQPFSFDPPRLNIGCGGIDAHLGSFSFITAEKLTDFLRKTAQSAGPLLFKMALENQFPQLATALAEFQDLAQRMNNAQTNSCEMARGFITGVSSGESWTRMTKSIGSSLSSAMDWADDFWDASKKAFSDPKEAVDKIESTRSPDGSRKVAGPGAPGNTTWEALKERKRDGILFNVLVDSETVGMELIMSMIGSNIISAGSTAGSDVKRTALEPNVLLLEHLIRPKIGQAAGEHASYYTCGAIFNEAQAKCLTPEPKAFQTSGIVGYVKTLMYGNSDGSTITDDSILGKLTRRCVNSTCGLTTRQMEFLRAISRLQTIPLLIKAQKVPGVVDAIAPILVDAMTDEMARIYTDATIDLLNQTFSNKDIEKPSTYDKGFQAILDVKANLNKNADEQLDRIKKISAHIDIAMRTNAKALSFSLQ